MKSLFDLCNSAMTALETCNVDDVHIANQFSRMCKEVLSRVQSKLVRIAASGNMSSRADSPSLNGRSPMPPTMGHAHDAALGGAGEFNPGNLLPFSVDEYNPEVHSVMPPPGAYGLNGQFEQFAGHDGAGMDENGFLMDNISSNWIGGELADLFMHNGADVTSSHFGPALNGVDFLDMVAPPNDSG